MYIAGETDIALVAEPVLTNILEKKPDTFVIFDLQEEWVQITKTGQSYPQAVVVINSNFVDNHQKATKLLLNEIEKSIEFGNDNPEKLGELAEKYETGLSK